MSYLSESCSLNRTLWSERLCACVLTVALFSQICAILLYFRGWVQFNDTFLVTYCSINVCALTIAKKYPLAYFKPDSPDPTVEGGKFWLILTLNIDRTRTCAWASTKSVCLR